MRRLAVVAAFLGLGASPQDGINWMNLVLAKNAANSKDKLVLVYIGCDPGSGMFT